MKLFYRILCISHKTFLCMLIYCTKIGDLFPKLVLNYKTIILPYILVDKHLTEIGCFLSLTEINNRVFHLKKIMGHICVSGQKVNYFYHNRCIY